MSLCGDVVKSNGGGNSGIKSDEINGVKKAWLKFVLEHQKELKDGKRFKIGDPALERALFPKSYHFRKTDGTTWP